MSIAANKSTWLTVTGTALTLIAAMNLMCAKTEEGSASYIVRADSAVQAARLVGYVGGEVTHTLAIIDSVAATLTPGEVTRLKAHQSVRQVTPDATVETAADAYVEFPALVDAAVVHSEGHTGQTVTLAVVDNGRAATADLQNEWVDLE